MGVSEFLNPRFVVSILVMAIFTWAFGENVDDDTMKGAIIGALNIAVGYWLGSSNSSNAVREQVGKALDLAAAAQPDQSNPQPVTVANTEDNPIPVETKP